MFHKNGEYGESAAKRENGYPALLGLIIWLVCVGFHSSSPFSRNIVLNPVNVNGY